ncbi:putative collagen alpha-1(XIII) chain [Scophthalmus maximus]|uniref:Putative collagen alpha-1(XIII) chain n=1 Tax=Scophthalmus maximus TaxID=52904 RepID=A0A2U9CFI4_SCOMX|nr:putative collagen alpha-1(XIII) chain [Scophthalmus maximus]
MDQGPKWGVAGGVREEEWSRRGEQEKPSDRPLGRSWRDFSGVTLCVAVSVLCLGVCVLVVARASELQSRVVSLERQQRDAQLSAWRVTLEQVEPVLLSRLDQILDERRNSLSHKFPFSPIPHK